MISDWKLTVWKGINKPLWFMSSATIEVCSVVTKGGVKNVYRVGERTGKTIKVTFSLILSKYEH